jgi:hypothetical protein
MTDVLVDPTDRGRGLVVVADVTHELACEILYGGKEGGDKDSSCRVVQQPHFPELPWLATNCCRAKFLICGNSRSLVPTAQTELIGNRWPSCWQAFNCLRWSLTQRTSRRYSLV